ncbi:MAG: ABC transporter permease [Bacteroidales bacterium]|jgi:putative ABC transport system permease protein|nr:ABC transporter permease [Bacteroidales bacterium]
MNRINIEILREIYHSIRQNKVRTILSGFGISWGILILVVLLGTGEGFRSSVMNLFSIFAQKSLYVYGGMTSEKHRNIKEGQEIRFDEKYLGQLKNRYPEIEAVSPETSVSLTVQNEAKNGTFRITGVNEDYMKIKILRAKEGGRLFSRADIENERNVAIIGENTETVLFGKKTGIEKYINISGIFFRVIGVLENDNIFSASEINSVYVPYSSYTRTINSNTEFSAFCLSLEQNADSKKFEEEMRNYIAHQSHFSVNDKQALYIANFETQTSAFESLFRGLRLFIWAVGVCFLISGIVGISNIMFVTVKERTNEIGIRLAVGAMPGSIVSLILLESVIITTISGLLGLVSGKGILMFINWLLTMRENDTFIKQMSFDAGASLMALFILVIAGVIAGAFPAIKASAIEPVEAIRYENRG